MEVRREGEKGGGGGVKWIEGNAGATAVVPPLLDCVKEKWWRTVEGVYVRRSMVTRQLVILTGMIHRYILFVSL